MTVSAGPVNSLSFNPQPFPKGYYAVDLKSCENCTGMFTRKRCYCNHLTETCGCQKYCADCVARMLLPPSEELPPGDFRKRQHIRYDDSLFPKERRKYRDWHAPLLEQFALKGKLTASEIQNVINCSGSPMSYVWNAVRSGSFPKVVAVGYAERTKVSGPRPRLYALEQHIDLVIASKLEQYFAR